MWFKFQLWLLKHLAWLYLHFVGKTSKIVDIDRHYRNDLEAAGQQYVNVVWHGRQVIFVYTHRGAKISPLASPSKDGEIIAQVQQLFGFAPSRGSSRREPVQALRRLIGRIQQGYSLAVTPDGPLGPEREVKPGALYLAQRFGLPVLPMTSALKRKIIIRGWDTFHFPLPFNRICIVYGKPFWIAPQDDLKESAKIIKKILDDITDEADRRAAL